MKRKAYLAALAMCVILAVSGCGDKEEAGSETTATEASQEENTDSEEVEVTPEPNVDADGHTRLVSGQCGEIRYHCRLQGNCCG